MRDSDYSQEVLDAIRTATNLESKLVLANSYDRFPLFYTHRMMAHGREYWECLAYAYSCSDDLYPHRRRVREAFSSNEPEREYLMDVEERQMLRELPARVSIYRAMTVKESKSKTFGISWTLSLDVAEFFRDAYIRNHSTRGMEHTIVACDISKDEIIALFDGREESEVIYLG